MQCMLTISGGFLRMKRHFGQAEMLPGARMIVDATLGQLAELGAHGLEELGVDIVVEVGERELFERHWPGPVLVVFEARHWKL